MLHQQTTFHPEEECLLQAGPRFDYSFEFAAENIGHEGILQRQRASVMVPRGSEGSPHSGHSSIFKGLCRAVLIRSALAA